MYVEAAALRAMARRCFMGQSIWLHGLDDGLVSHCGEAIGSFDAS
jgi:hypothetical protein